MNILIRYGMDKLKFIVTILIYLGATFLFVEGVLSIVTGIQMPDSAGLGAWANIGGGMIVIGISVAMIGLVYLLKKNSIL